MKKINQRQLQKLQKRDNPINYNYVSIASLGSHENLQVREKANQIKSLLEKRVVAGYGVIWGSKNDYGERFVKGCCAKAISDMGPNSNSTYKIKFRDRHGKTCSLFAELIEDEIGLYFKTHPLDDVSWANDLLVQLKSGSINNFSIGFKYCWDKVEFDEDEDCLVCLEIRLFEISAVDIPSDTETFAIRSAEDKEIIKEDIEEFILSIPKSKHIEARALFTRALTLSQTEQPSENREALKNRKQKKGGIDYKFLTQNLNF